MWQVLFFCSYAAYKTSRLLSADEYFLQVCSIDSILKTSTVDCLWFLCVVVEWQVLSGVCEICDCLGILV